jgi:nitrite reductase/ring-hydroxylating ferredoxin subunit
MGLVSICPTDELGEGERHIEEVDGVEIAVFNVDGEYRAVVNFCVHQGGPVCEGSLTGTTTATTDELDYDWEREGEIINCPWHGWEFDLQDGGHLSDPKHRLITYDVVVEDDTVKVETDRG